MVSKAIPRLFLVTALLAACNGNPPAHEPQAAAPPTTRERSAGAEQGFPDPESYAHQLDDPEREEWQRPDEIVGLLECRSGMAVADLGAGTGYFIDYLSEAVGPGGRVLALDTDPAMIEAIRARIGHAAIQNTWARIIKPDDPGLADGSVDRVLTVNTWHHLSNRVDYARKLLAALRPGGLLLVVDFTVNSPHGPPAGQRVTSDTVARELAAAGFLTELLDESLPFQYVVAGRVP
jgi:predicted methyltransferase